MILATTATTELTFAAADLSLAPPSSDNLLFHIAAGTRGAVEQCISRYGSLVWGLARRLTQCPADAEDAAQEIFLEIWRHAARFDPARGSEQAFIATLARRRLVDRFRRTRTEPLIDAEADVARCAALDFESLCHHGLDARRAVLAMAALRPHYREVLELAFLQGMTQAQIAAHLSLPLGSVKSFMRRALVQLRESLSEQAPPVRSTSGVADRWLPIRCTALAVEA